MPFNWGLLSDQSLANQPPELRQGLQEQASRQFLLGTFLGGGGFRTGYAAAQAVPEQFQTQVEQRALDRAVAQTKRELTRPVGLGLDVQGQQAQMLADQEAGLGNTASTVAALQSNPNIPRQLDVAEYARRLPGIIAEAGPRAKLGNLEKIIDTQLKLAPTVSENAILDPLTKRPIGFLPQVRDGIAQQLSIDASGQITGSAIPLTGYQQARVATSVPQASQNMQLTNLPGGRIGAQVLPGALEGINAIESATTAARISQTPRVVRNALNQEVAVFDVPPALRQPAIATPTINQPTSGRITQPNQPSTGPVGGQQTFADVTRQKGFETDYNAAQTAQATASSRKQAAEYIYSAADQLDPNVATPFFANAATYLRAIPGVGDKYDTFVGNYNLMNKSRAQGILNGFGSIKGNANPQEVRIVENAASNPTQDPRWATKWISALEIAAADKDVARLNFLNNYQGRPGGQNSAWENSPENIRIYSHPMVDRFLREQIAANPTQPVLPAGFKLQQSRQTGQYFIAKPDGSRIPVGQ